ncbi:hypothetical protein LEP1GSC005_3953 [Leptospira santarosai str. ST188]|nr:hypothetical protein LEP1GSC005_3953 [Leptospira santarosai str. ST188]
MLFFADAIVVFTLRVVRYVPLHLSRSNRNNLQRVPKLNCR